MEQTERRALQARDEAGRLIERLVPGAVYDADTPVSMFGGDARRVRLGNRISVEISAGWWRNPGTYLGPSCLVHSFYARPETVARILQLLAAEDEVNKKEERHG